MDEEIQSIKQNMIIDKEELIANRKFYLGKLDNKPIVLVKSEWGKVNAGVTTQLLISFFEVEKIIFTGVAGGVDPHLQIGDIIISTKLYQHDYAYWTDEGLKPMEIPIPMKDGKDKGYLYFEADEGLISLAEKSAKALNFPEIPQVLTKGKRGRMPKVVKGIIVSGDQFIQSEKKRIWLKETFDAKAVEMEGASVAQVCTTNNIPFVVIRTLSDLADKSSYDTFHLLTPYAAGNSSLLIKEMIKNLKD